MLDKITAQEEKYAQILIRVTEVEKPQDYINGIVEATNDRLKELENNQRMILELKEEVKIKDFFTLTVRYRRTRGVDSEPQTNSNSLLPYYY